MEEEHIQGNNIKQNDDNPPPSNSENHNTTTPTDVDIDLRDQKSEFITKEQMQKMESVTIGDTRNNKISKNEDENYTEEQPKKKIGYWFLLKNRVSTYY